MSFITDDFLLTTDQGRELYHSFAKDEPIFDYHCHLPPAQIAANHQFADLQEIWLAARNGGFHFKWADSAWRDTRDGVEFFARLSDEASRQGGQPLRFSAA